MKSEDHRNRLEEPAEGYGPYSYADYLGWKFDGMAEIIKGTLYKMTPAPKRVHQKIAHRLSGELYLFLKEKTCEAYEAPFDVRLPSKSNKNEDIYTVVQPDICVVCDLEKLDEAGCLGAPDLVVEILSPGNNVKDLKIKYEVYEESGVLEYWVIHPEEQTLLKYCLLDGKYQASRLFISGDIVNANCLPGFEISLEELFSDL